ncbi:cytochrome c oxidase subunit II [Halomicrobium sp. HM KBTZ05]|uniref:cytochrome-c oxidase n=1 Tax=Halomicrobium mukohataei TaxID=57705 RepID=A0A847UJ53_9EURY|nr:cytochrome c oxidase subunit II [Halomicrobium mukohataei]NLV11118.1 cytochrome c oxidase subunit II [Halomicrobium mukohataei]
MKRHRVGLVALFGAIVFAALTQPAVAQTSASETSELIWGLNMSLLYVAIPITVLVEGILIYTVWRFSKNDEPLPTMENRRLEITWTVATAIILLFVGVASYQVMAEPMVTAQSTQQLDTSEEPLEVEVVAQKYAWTFNYNGTAANTSQEYSADNRLSNGGTLVLPANRTVRLSVTSTDWLHAFHVPGLALKQDAMPGQHNTIQTRVTETGTYQLYCAEYCGSGHSQMLGEVRVLPQDEYQNWVEDQQSS